MVRQQPRAVIIGGSMAGLFAGLFLRQTGWHVDIFERTAEPLSARGAGIVTHLELRMALKALGLNTDTNFGVPIHARVVVSDGDRIIARRDVEQIAASWTRVHTLLSQKFPSENYHAGVEFTRFEASDEAVTIQFADGKSVSADLLIGADGFRSRVRHSLFPSIVPEYAGYVAWRGIVPECHVDAEPFVQSSLFSFNLPPGEHMVGYPVAGVGDDAAVGRRRYNFVWYRPAEAARELPVLLTDRHGFSHDLSIPPHLIAPAVIAEMRTHAERVLAPWFKRVVAHTPQPFLQPIYDLSVPRMAEGRVALVGDAAFVVRPHVGAGVLKAANDGQALAAHVGSSADDIQQRLQAFSAERHLIGMKMIARARYLGSYLRYSFETDEERRAAALMGRPETVLAETAVLDFLTDDKT